MYIFILFILNSKDNIRRDIIGSIGDIRIETEFNKRMVSTNLIIVDHEMSFDNFEQAINEFIRLRTNGALSLLERACLHYMVLYFLQFVNNGMGIKIHCPVNDLD
jgi:hypothetical protein